MSNIEFGQQPGELEGQIFNLAGSWRVKSLILTIQTAKISKIQHLSRLMGDPVIPPFEKMEFRNLINKANADHGDFDMKITSLDNIEKAKVIMDGAKGVWKQVPISKNDGSPTFSFRVFTVEQNGYTPFHRHPYEHLNYIIEGHGALVTESGEECEVKRGDFALVPADQKHQYKNKSTSTPLIMICGVPKDYE